MTITWQKFKFGQIERKFDLSRSAADDPQFIYAEDVMEIFKLATVDRFEANGSAIPYMRDSHGIMYNPKRIPCRPGYVIEVIYETAQPELISRPSTRTAQSRSSTMTLSESVDQLSIKDEHPITSDRLEPSSTTLSGRTTTHLHSGIKSLNDAIMVATQSGQQLDSKAMENLITKHLASTSNNSSNTMEQKVDLLVRGVGGLQQQGTVLEQLARKMIEMQQQALDRLSLIQRKTEAILTQQLEIAEYPIPRLFIVLPEETKEYDPGNWFRTKFRLHFICECGKHTEAEGSKEQHHLHLAKHEGYVIREPTKFFKKYGPFLLLMLEMIKFGTGVAGIVVPALTSLKVIELTDSVKQTVDKVMGKIDYSLECIDKQFSKVEASSPGEFAIADSPTTMTQKDLANYLNNVEGLEGVELRQLGSFLKTSAKDNLLGNLYRMTTSEGHVKWVCRDHYRAGDQEKHIQKLREVVQQAKGEFDEQLGKIKITLASSIVASEFYSAIGKAKGVLELDVRFDWKCSKNDVGMFEKALRITRVSILQLDIMDFQTILGSVLRSTSSQFEIFFQLQHLPHMKSIHIVISWGLMPILSFQPKSQVHACKLTFAVYFSEVAKQPFETIMKAIKENPLLTVVGVEHSALGNEGVTIISEALKQNPNLTELYLLENSIGHVGAMALGEALKTNSNLSLLNLSDNSIGDAGARVLGEALQTNSNLSVLDLRKNSIGIEGAFGLSEALKTNSTIAELYLRDNSIGDTGAYALSEAIKTNSNLKALSLSENLIGNNGAAAISKALLVNSSLTDLGLLGNSIGDAGVWDLADTLKYNSTLTKLYLGENLIGDTGATALSEAIKVNSSLRILGVDHNSIGDDGAMALLKALAINSTMTELYVGENSMGEEGARTLRNAKTSCEIIF